MGGGVGNSRVICTCNGQQYVSPMQEEFLDGSTLTFQMVSDTSVDVTSQVVGGVYVISSLHETHSLDVVFGQASP